MGTLRLMKKSLTSAFLCLVFTNFMIEVSGNISSQRFDSAFDTAEQIKIEFQYEGNSPTTQRANCFEVSFPETRFNFKGRFYSSVYICANGMVRFDGPEYAANPINFGIFSSLPIIAPYWSQVDLRFLNNSNSNVTYRLYQNSNENTAVFDTINTVVETNTEIKNYSANWVLVVTWVCLAPRQPVDNNFPERNTFQLLLADDLFNGAFTLFIYESITWSFGVNRNEYTNFRDASDLPVIGFDSGRRDITPRFQIYETSGTINADRVGDEMTILYDLRSPFPRSNAEECQIWVNQQLISPTRRSSCRNNCAQDLQTAYLNLTGVFFTLFRRVKGSGPTPNFCIYSGTTLDGADECCYQYTGQLESYPQSFNSTAVNSFSSFTISESSALGAAPGRWHEVHPRENFTKYLQEEQRYNQCCVDAGSTQESCDQFYRVRPICIGVSFEFVSTWANNFGDPHFVTLDRKNYTFNGCGWYTYFIGQIPGNDASSLEVQVRTTRVGNANATGFTAFAIKEGNSQVIQVNLNTTTKGLDVRVGGMLIPPPGENGIIRNGTAITFADNLLQISTPLGNGARVNVVNGSFFTLVMLFLDGYRNNSFGLSGRWNGNMTDDFTHSDRKTITPIDADERAIFHYFGESWKVNETNGQGIYMNVDEGINTFSCQNFTPAFFDELENNNTNFTMEAREACGSNTFCLFDALATQNIAIGQSTRDEQRLTDNVIAQVENIPPEFTTNTSLITANLNETLTVTLEAQDMDANDILTFDVPNLPSVSSFNVSGNTLTFTWTANSTAVVDLKFVVSDSRNRTAVLTPRVQICACRDKSTCVVPEGAGNATFVVMSCNCNLGYTGRFCNEVVDFCNEGASRPCSPLVTCTSMPTQAECGPCPTGYSGNGVFCLDIDECARNTSGCEQICTNNLASFSCGCSPGFTISANGRTCIDIDECLRPNNCSQVCENTVGSFSCNCRQGFELEADGEQCRVRTNCSQNGNCAQICFVDDNGNDTCACAKGYALGSDGRSCNDINECENVGTCSQQCMNTDGSFMCGCFPGYTLASDMFSCEDIDECSDLTRQTCNITNGEDCINIPGSFTCRCAARLNLIRVNNICVYNNGSILLPLAPTAPTATNDQMQNAVEITLLDVSRYTAEVDSRLKDSVATILNDFCKLNQRPRICGVSGSFTFMQVRRLPGFPSMQGNNVTLRFYVDYPSTLRNGTLEQDILASILFTELNKLKSLLMFNITLNTPSSFNPSPPSAEQQANSVLLSLLNTPSQITIFQERYLRLAMAITINEYCAVDNYRRTEDCGLTDSGVSFSMSNVNIASTTYGQYANISFYVNNPRNQGFLSALTLASILVMRETNFELLLEQQITIQTSFAPMNPPTASDDQIINSIIIEITFNLNQWNFLIDRRLRSAAIAPRVSAYCRLNSVTCDLRNRASTFSVDNVQRTSAATPSAAMSTNQIYYRFYVKYPQTNTSIPQNILATIVTAEELVVESLSRLSFSLQTPPDTVQIRVFNLQINQFDTSLFRTNLARAAEEFCGVRESLCNFSSSSAIVSSAINISPDNVTILPRSPSTIGDGLLLSFTLQKPDGSALSPVILRTAIRTSRTQVISQNNSIITPPFVNPPLSDDQRLNLVRLNINASDTSIDREAFRLDVQYSIALRMNEFCRNNTNSSLCSSNQFTINDVIVQIETNGSVSFAVLLPSTNTPLNSNEVQSVTNGTLMSSIFNVSLNMLNNDNNVMTTMPPDEDDDPDFALILGLSIGGLVLLIFVVVAVVCLKARNSNASKFPVATDGGGSWQFDRDAPYTGSAFAGAERIPGFDDDGLPTEISSGGNDPGTI